MATPDAPAFEADHAGRTVPTMIPARLRRIYVVCQQRVPILDPEYVPPTSWVKSHKAISGLTALCLLASLAVRVSTSVFEYALAPVVLAMLLSSTLAFGSWLYISAYMAWRATRKSRVSSEAMASASESMAKAVIVSSTWGLVALATLELVGQNTIAVAVGTACVDILALAVLRPLADALHAWDGL